MELVVLVALGVVASPGVGQESTAEQPLPRAQALFAGEEGEKAAEAYETMVREEPENGDAWFHLGTCYFSSGADGGGPPGLQEGRFPGDGGGFLLSLRAAVAADSLRRKEETLSWLDRVVERGLPVGVLKGHPALADIRASLEGDPRYQAIVEKVKKRHFLAGTTPCTGSSISGLGSGSLRGLIQRSNDGGRTWATYFDATYVRTR